jgi:hypothetical protein
MPYVLPSQAVALIDRIFPWAKQGETITGNVDITFGMSGAISVIVDAVKQIPSELIALEGDDYAAFAASLNTLEHALVMWHSQGGVYRIGDSTPGFRQISPMILLRTGLAKCPDDAPTKGTSELNFITDIDLRNNLRLDISTSHSALIHGEWKASTIIAGSVVEALLLWRLQQTNPTDIKNSVSSLISSRRIDRDPGNDLLRWSLNPFIEVANDLQMISDSTANQCRIAKDFRNLIHPGKVERLGIRCSRGTAHAAIAAMEQVIEDLQ